VKYGIVEAILNDRIEGNSMKEILL
jgi:hypothetical protein